MATLTLQVIKDQADYDAVVERITHIFDASPETLEGDELKTLLHLVDSYQQKNQLLPEVEPVEVIKFMMKQRDLSLQDIAQYIGGEEMACHILSGKRDLTLQMISNLSANLHISAKALVQV